MIEAAAFVARLGLAGDDVDSLAAAWSSLRPDRLATGLRAAGVVLDEDQALEAWLVLGEHLAERASRAQVAHDTGPGILDAGTIAAIDGRTGLILDDGLCDLPLLALAAEVAETLPQGRLSVRLVPGGMGIAAGCFVALEGAGGLILVDEDLSADEVCERVFPHELGHALDSGMSAVSTAGAEAFADRLAPMLLELEPATIAEARPLVDRVLEATRPVRRSVPPSRCALGELLEWCLASSSPGWQPSPELVAAYRGRP